MTSPMYKRVDAAAEDDGLVQPALQLNRGAGDARRLDAMAVQQFDAERVCLAYERVVILAATVHQFEIRLRWRH